MKVYDSSAYRSNGDSKGGSRCTEGGGDHILVSNLHFPLPLLSIYIAWPILNMTDLFSTPAEHAFDHPELESLSLSGNAEAGPSSNGDAVSKLDVEEAFEVEDTVRRIIDGGYKTVGNSIRLSHRI